MGVKSLEEEPVGYFRGEPLEEIVISPTEADKTAPTAATKIFTALDSFALKK